jgi:membrane protein/epoxyqueuosine reductase
MNNSVNSEVSAAAAPAVARIGKVTPPQRRRGYISRSLHQLRTGAWPTLKYLAETEVHTYAFSVAANAILSFVPAVVLMGTISRYILHSRPMYNLLFQLLQSYLPTWDYKVKVSVVNNLQGLVKQHHTIEVISVVMLLISATGVFEPLEVALNKVWGFKANRSYLMNQVVSLGLALGCGVLALGSVALTTQTQSVATPYVLSHWTQSEENPEGPANLQQLQQPRTAPSPSQRRAAAQEKRQQQAKEVLTFAGRITRTREQIVLATRWVVMKAFALITSSLIFFLIYWLLPNGRVKAGDVLPAAFATGVSLEIAKYGFMGIMHFLDFREDYGLMFYIPVTLIFWAFTAGLLMLGGAHLSAYGKAEE